MYKFVDIVFFLIITCFFLRLFQFSNFSFVVSFVFSKDKLLFNLCFCFAVDGPESKWCSHPGGSAPCVLCLSFVCTGSFAFGLVRLVFSGHRSLSSLAPSASRP